MDFSEMNFWDDWTGFKSRWIIQPYIEMLKVVFWVDRWLKFWFNRSRRNVRSSNRNVIKRRFFFDSLEALKLSTNNYWLLTTILFDLVSACLLSTKLIAFQIIFRAHLAIKFSFSVKSIYCLPFVLCEPFVGSLITKLFCGRLTKN